MNKIIAFLGLSLLVLTNAKLDAGFAIAIASEMNGFPHQVAYIVAYNDGTSEPAKYSAANTASNALMQMGFRNGKLWNIAVRAESTYTGSFRLAHGFFAVVRGFAGFPLESAVMVMGVGVDANNSNTALRNAINDMQASHLNYFGVIADGTLKVLEQGKF